MGTVYLAEDPADGRRVAVKVLPRAASQNPEFLKRFQREAEAAAKLHHPCIAAGYAAGHDGGIHYYVMEYCDGESLDRLLRRDKSLPPQRALEILLQVTKGLQHAHARGVIHRDIKPANIFITRDGGTKILDLGLAKNMGDSEASLLTMSGTVVGTPHYISPEQAEGTKALDGRADIYSLGATFYHLLTGHTPFDGSSPVEVMYKHAHGELPNPQDLRDDIPESYVHLLRKMMAKDPANRYRSCDELFADLKEIITGGSPRSAPLDSRESTIAPVRRSRAIAKRPPTFRRPEKSESTPVLVLGIMGGLVVLVGILFFAGGGRETMARRQVPAKEPASKPPWPPRGATSVPPTPEEDPWRRAIPLLPQIDLVQDCIKGTWRAANGELDCDAALGARVTIPFEPPEEYDLRMEFTQSGPTLGLEMILSGNARVFHWLMGAWGNAHFGLGYREGEWRVDKILFRTDRPKGCLVPGRRYRTIVKIRRGRVTASFDDEVLVDATTDLSTLALSRVYPFPPGTSLGIMSNAGATRIHRLELLEITGKGRFRRAPKPAPQWVALFDGKTLDCLIPSSRTGWQVDHGALMPRPGATLAAEVMNHLSDGQVRIQFEAQDLAALGLAVKQGPEGEYGVYLTGEELSRLAGRSHAIVLACDGDRVEATLDGKPIEVKLKDLPRREGAIHIYHQGGGLRILSIETRDRSAR